VSLHTDYLDEAMQRSGVSLINRSQPVLERIENWQKKKEAHISKLSEEAKSKEELPSFKYLIHHAGLISSSINPR
jgi:hypothetical protein